MVAICNKNITQKITVFIVGKTGVGKSTIVNQVIGLDVARTGCGSPVTDEIHEYCHHSIPFSIIDTVGLEICGYRKIIDSLYRYIDSRINVGEKDDNICVAWLCINMSGERVDEEEIKLVDNFFQHGVPTIIALTKAINSGGQFVKNLMVVLPKVSSIIPIRSLPEEIEGCELKPSGVDKLIDETYKLAFEKRRLQF